MGCSKNIGNTERPSEANAPGDLQIVKIYKPDESVQCERDGIEVNSMKTQLTAAGITVFCAQKADNGLMVIALCGAPTTSINVYAIHVSDLLHAEKLGFKRIEELTEYKDSGCKE